MENRELKSNKYDLNLKFTRNLVNCYLLIVLILGLWYQIKSRSGNIGTILAYTMGDTAIATQAYIYTSIFELVFIIFAILGSILLLLLFNLKYEKLIIIYFFIQLITMMSYIVSRITLITATLHMVTNGEIKNTDFSNMKFILERYITDTKFIVVTLVLLVGVIFIPVIINRYNKLSMR